MAEKCVRVAQDTYEGSVTVRWYGRNDSWVQGVGGITSRIGSEAFLVYNGDEQVDGQDDVRGGHCNM